MYRILELNPQLVPFSDNIDLRMNLYRNTKNRLLTAGQDLKDFANGHNFYGFHHVEGGWYYREWAPSADQLYLEGEYTPIGVNKNDVYLYIGPASHDLTKLDATYRIHDRDNNKYMIDRAEKIMVKDTIVYIWAVIRRTTEGDL